MKKQTAREPGDERRCAMRRANATVKEPLVSHGFRVDEGTSIFDRVTEKMELARLLLAKGLDSLHPTILVGMATPQQFEHSLAAVQKGPLPSAALARLTSLRQAFAGEPR